MKSKMKILVLIVILAIGAFVTIGIASAIADDGTVRYNYEVEIVNSFTDKYGDVQDSDENCNYAIMTIAVVNDSFSDGFSTNDMIFDVELVIDGLSYSNVFETMYHPNYKLVTIEVGGSTTFTYVFEIPDDAKLDNIQVKFDYLFDNPDLKFDDSLEINPSIIK